MKGEKLKEELQRKREELCVIVRQKKIIKYIKKKLTMQKHQRCDKFKISTFVK